MEPVYDRGCILRGPRDKKLIALEFTGGSFADGGTVPPYVVVVIPTDTSPATVGVFTVTEGAHDKTNVVVTVTSGKKYKIIAYLN